MRTILIVAATDFELESLMRELKLSAPEENLPLKCFSYRNLNVDVLITGAGMVNTAFFLGQLNTRKYDLAINAGICGSFKDELKIGELINITKDHFSDLGAQDGENYLSISEINLGEEKISPLHSFGNAKIDALKQVEGITVNTVHGNEAAIKKIKGRLNPDVESMEGAAFFKACNYYKWPCVQIRAVSNKVERRNRESWNIPLAIKNLNDHLFELLKSL
jgi:futalosine hydrolase